MEAASLARVTWRPPPKGLAGPRGEGTGWSGGLDAQTAPVFGGRRYNGAERLAERPSWPPFAQPSRCRIMRLWPQSNL